MHMCVIQAAEVKRVCGATLCATCSKEREESERERAREMKQILFEKIACPRATAASYHLWAVRPLLSPRGWGVNHLIYGFSCRRGG